MSQRRMGPPPHAEDPYTRLTSPRGIPVDQLVSVLQKEIRRSNTDNAVLAAYEMLTTSPEPTVSVTSLTAVRSPYPAHRPSTRSIGVATGCTVTRLEPCLRERPPVGRERTR